MHGNITTKNDLVEVFGQLGLKQGMEVMVHSSLKSLGFVVNGPLDVIDALLQVIGKEGTLLMPSHTGQLTDPAEWKNPPLPSEEVEVVRRCMNPFDPKTTPIRNRGVIPQVFLMYPNVSRSHHPLNSVLAQGRQAESYTQSHPLHSSEGMESPIGKMYQRGGYMILIGVTLAQCTAIHLAEFIADVSYLKKKSLKVLCRGKDGNNEFVHLERYPNGSEHFDKVRRETQGQGLFKEINFRSGTLIMFSIKPVVDFVVRRLKEDEEYLLKP